jgi:molybdopterin/thiamine biosynthesis adenylyltransferase
MKPPIALRLTEGQEEQLRGHLFQGDGLETVALALCGQFRILGGTGYCLHEVVPVATERCSVRRPDAVTWPVELVVPLLEKAAARGLVLLKVHSHPTGYDGFSSQDDETDRRLADSFRHQIEGEVTHLSAFILESGELRVRAVGRDGEFCSVGRVVRVGDRIEANALTEAREPDMAQASSLQAFGDGTYHALRSLRVGVVGCSGTGSWVVEMLARLGVGGLVLVDPDVIERRNLNRIVNSTAEDVAKQRPKVELLREAVISMDQGTLVEPFQQDLLNVAVVQSLAACDLLFGCVDSADGRDLLNRISTFYLVPLIDVGVRIDAGTGGKAEQICGAVHFMVPGGSSLLSRGVITAKQVETDGMRRHQPEQHDELMREGYVKGVAVNRPAVVSLNGFIAAHAVNELLARIHGFRRDDLSEFRHQLFDLRDGAWHRIDEGAPCHALRRFAGRGDMLPLLNNPSLS